MLLAVIISLMRFLSFFDFIFSRIMSPFCAIIIFFRFNEHVGFVGL